MPLTGTSPAIRVLAEGGGGAVGARISASFSGTYLTDPNPFPFDTADWGAAAYMVNLASHALTIPVTGRYLVAAVILGAASLVADHSMGFEVENTGDDVVRPAFYGEVKAGPSNGISATASTPMSLAAGDELTVRVSTDGIALDFSGINCALAVIPIP